MENNIKDIGNQCTGCRACASACHKKAISFEANIEGFMYPMISSDKCVNCGLCRKICPAINVNVNEEQQEGYAAYLRDKELLSQSASGGIFTALAMNVIERGGVVVGCGMDENHLPCHTMIDSSNDISSLQSSKYAQSDMTNIYECVMGRLNEGKLVLFSGTPCQIAGLKNLFLYHTPDNLYTCDIICHGVPSRKLLKEYYNWLEKKYDGKLISYNFRSKVRNGWSLTYRAEFLCKKNRRKVIENIASIDPYYDGFLNSENYRESCYSCPYSQNKRAGDITIGDFWGIEKEIPKFNNINGVSAILTNTAKGKKMFGEVLQDIEFKEVSPEILFKNNGNLNEPSKRPYSRDSYYDIVDKLGFDAIYSTLSKSKRFKVEIIRNMFPNHVRQSLKAIIRPTGKR